MDISKLSKEELKAELERRDSEAKKEQRAKETAHLNRKKDFLSNTILKFISSRNELKQLKDFTISEANKLWNEMYEIQGAKPKEQKRITVTHENFKIVVECREKFEFTDEATVHIDAIKEILKNKFESRNKGMYSFFETILLKNNAGDYDAKLLTKAKKKAIELGYDDLIEELEKLQNCLTVNGTAMYCRAYKKAENGAFKDIVIQFSSL